MSISQYEVPPFEHQARTVKTVTENYESQNEDDVVFAVGAGITIKLPANPTKGKRITLGATGNTLTIDGNGHTIVGSIDTLASGGQCDFTFSGSDSWVSEATTS